MGEVKRCAACGKENPVSEMKVCMHQQMHRYVCDSKCMTDFYNQPKKPTAAELEAKVATLEAENAKLRAELERRAVPDDLLARCADWCDGNPKQPWYGRTAGDMVRTFMACQPLCAPSAPKADDPVKQMLLEALEKVDSEHEILGWMKTCELRRGRGSFGIAVMSDELALDWQSHQKNLERLIELRRAAIAAARKEGGKV